jgi:hypothetical protein
VAFTPPTLSILPSFPVVSINRSLSSPPLPPAADPDLKPVRRWTLPIPSRPRTTLPFSALAQADGLLYACLGVRAERDVFAPSAKAAGCAVFGCPSWFSPSTFVGLYHCHFSLLNDTVAAVAANHACGLFFVPSWQDQGAGVVLNDEGKHSSWYRALHLNSLLVFDLDPSLRGDSVEAHLRILRLPKSCPVQT